MDIAAELQKIEQEIKKTAEHLAYLHGARTAFNMILNPPAPVEALKAEAAPVEAK